MMSTSFSVPHFLSAAAACPHDFTFIIDGKRYECHRIVVFSLAPAIANQCLNTSREYSFGNIKDPKNYFQLFSDYFHGKEIKICFENAPFFEEIGTILGMGQFVQCARQYLDALPKNLVEQMKVYSECGVENIEFADEIASSWDVYEKDESLYELPPLAFKLILESQYLKYESESKLYQYIKKLIEKKGKKYISLFSVLQTADLEQNEIAEILEMSQYENIKPDILNALKERFTLAVEMPIVAQN